MSSISLSGLLCCILHSTQGLSCDLGREDIRTANVMACLSFCFKKKVACPPKQTIDVEEGVQNVKLYTFRELSIATGNFSPANKIGEGGFGSVYKGKFKDGTMVAIKVLSTDSRQGLREFLTEIIVISHIQHENLVELYGCCVEESHRILVYGYLENSSLAQTLLGGGHSSSIQFSWKTRSQICIGIARGLAFLHEEVRPHVIHRDIKASNILLDKHLTPKISDFGLAKLFPPDMTHISTRVGGTLGYLAPEYAIRGQLTKKADIYSFGVLLLEIVSGTNNTNKRLPIGDRHLLDRAWRLYEKGELRMLVDIALEQEVDIVDEATKFLKIALLCTQDSPKLRPSMSTVVKLLIGVTDVDDKKISKPGLISEITGHRSQQDTSYTTDDSRKLDDGPLSGITSDTCATMTFASIYNRSI